MSNKNNKVNSINNFSKDNFSRNNNSNNCNNKKINNNSSNSNNQKINNNSSNNSNIKTSNNSSNNNNQKINNNSSNNSNNKINTNINNSKTNQINDFANNQNSNYNNLNNNNVKSIQGNNESDNFDDTIKLNQFKKVDVKNSNLSIMKLANTSTALQNKTKKSKNKFYIIILIILLIISILMCGFFFYLINSKIEFSLIENEDPLRIEVSQDLNYIDKGFIAKLNSKDISNKVIVSSNVDTSQIGKYTVKYTLDIALLKFHQELTRNIVVQDTESPALKVNSEDETIHYIGDPFETPKYSAIDNYDGDITDKVQVTSNINLEKEGKYTISYYVTDSSNNESSKTITIKVERKKDPHIIVNISTQTLYYYEYDKCVLSSPVVTGKNNKTPTGNFSVLNKAKNVTLKGENYESFVNYWIAFKGSSFGFHDASWRSTFGGSIYKSNGSHGCVNMPYNKVKTLYDMVSLGTPVNIHY